MFNYGIYTARDYWKQITKPHIDEYKSQRSPKNAVQVVQSLWGLVLWCADEQGKGWPIFVADLMVHHPKSLNGIGYGISRTPLRITGLPIKQELSSTLRSRARAIWLTVMAKLREDMSRRNQSSP